MSSPIRYIDLFCGLGAFHQAFKQANNIPSPQNIPPHYQCVYACDIDPKVRQLYQANHGIRPDGDIHSLDLDTLPPFDLLCAGFPCQPFSTAGRKDGFRDPQRGNLFFRVLEILDRHHPRQCILENVRNLAYLQRGALLERVLAELRARGYQVSHALLDSREFGSTQSRQRLYIVADLHTPYLFPTGHQPPRPVRDILDPTETAFLNITDRYYLEPTTTRPKSYKCYQSANLISKATGKGRRQGERVYSIDHCGPTICASSGGPGGKTGLYQIGDRFRRLNVQECLAMFGFPTSYIWSPYVTHEQMLGYLGNSIVVPVLCAIINNLPPS